MVTTTIDSPPRRMSCMEIWGGNTAVTDLFETVGLDLFVQSQPYKSSQLGGGDIYYVTSCASARITRLLLADVSGHGEAASGLALSLRDLMRQQVNSIDQRQFVEQMNREFGKAANDAAFATAVVATYFHPTRSLTVALAGHPNPLGFDRASGRWKRLVPADRRGKDVSNIPLGVTDDAKYRSGRLKVVPDDMLLMYTDAYIEAELKDGSMLGLDGLVRELNDLEQDFTDDTRTPREVARRLNHRINSISKESLSADDASLIIGRFTDTSPRLRDDAVAPIRLLTQVKDNTNLK